MELTASFVELLQDFAPVFTTPTFQTFLEIVTGWILSHRHRYVTEVIFAGGNVGNGHWCRFHRFFSEAAWDIDILGLFLARLVGTILAPGSTLFWAVDDTLCRKRGLTLYGAGMHYDPLISSHAKPLVSWGHDWVVLCLIVVKPFCVPTKVFALPIVVRLYRNRQGLTKGKKSRGRASTPKPNPDHRTRPELARELIELVAKWYPDDEIILTGDSAYGGKSILSYLPANVHLISHVHPKGALLTSVPRSRRREAREHLEERGPPARHGPVGQGSGPALDSTQIQPVRAACDARGQNDEGSLLQGRWRPRVDDSLGARLGGKAPGSDVLLHQARMERQADGHAISFGVHNGSGFVGESALIAYQSFSSGLFLNTDNNGSPVDIEGTSVPTTVNIGTGNTTVSIASQSQTLANLKASLLLQGGVGSNSLNVFDRNDAIKSTLPYVLQAGALERPVSATTYGPWITYKWFPKGITLQTDNNGTPIDVEGVSTPTTVDLGSGNTAVTVAQNVKSLSPFVTSVYVQSPLTLNGGPGSDSLTVNDQNTAYFNGQSGSYTISANSIWLVVPDGADNLPRLAQINYQSFLGGVTLNTDNNGTPVDVEGISGPTTVNLGSGNTKVTDSATGESLAGMTTSANFEYLKLNGGSGSDSLIVNDTNNTISSTQDSYTVNAGSIVRSDPETILYLHLVLTASIYYAGFSAVALNTDNNGTRVDVEGTSAPTTINTGSGNTVVDVTTIGQNLGQIGSNLTVNGGIGLDSLVVNDSANPLAQSTTRLGTSVTARTYSYGVTSSDISRSATTITTSLSIRGTLVRTSTSTLNINYASIRAGVTLDTDNNSTPVMVSGAPGTAPVTIDGGTGTNSIYGPAVANTWSLTGTNTGVLDNWVHFNGFANLFGGTLSDSFDFTSSSEVTGNIKGIGGNDLVNYARDSSSVTVNLNTGAASGVVGSISGIQGAVGGSGNNILTGSGRSLLIGGAGPAQLFGGSGDSLLIAGTTTFDLTDAALESILDEWDRTDLGFTQRMQHLTSGGGLNGSNILASGTVSGTGKADTITSEAGQAWIFASKYDKVVSQKSTDVVTTLSN